MTLGNLKVHHAMPRSDSHDAGTKLRIYRFVFDDRACNRSVDPLGFKGVAVLVLGVTFIFGVHYHVFISKLSSWPRRSNLKWPKFKGIKLGGFLGVFHLIVAHVGLEVW